MVKIHVISVGKKHWPEYKAAIDLFEKRLTHYCSFQWLLIPDSSQGVRGIYAEAQAILQKIEPTDCVIALDSSGTNYSSEALSTLLNSTFAHASRICIVIGGAYGLDPSILSRANATWSLGKATYPHQLVRVIVTEQLYRAYSIQHGLPYHHA